MVRPLGATRVRGVLHFNELKVAMAGAARASYTPHVRGVNVDIIPNPASPYKRHYTGHLAWDCLDLASPSMGRTCCILYNQPVCKRIPPLTGTVWSRLKRKNCD